MYINQIEKYSFLSPIVNPNVTTKSACANIKKPKNPLKVADEINVSNLSF